EAMKPIRGLGLASRACAPRCVQAPGFRSPVGQSGGWRRRRGRLVVPPVPGPAAPGRHLNRRELHHVPRAGGRKLSVRLPDALGLVAGHQQPIEMAPPRGPEVKIQALDRAASLLVSVSWYGSSVGWL